MQQAYPQFENVIKGETAAMLNTSSENIKLATLARNGVGYLLIELNDDELLCYLEKNEELVYDYSAKHNLIGIYPFVEKKKKCSAACLAPITG